jgi:hypothetical protein
MLSSTNTSSTNTWVVLFGLNPTVWTAAAIILRDKNTVEAVEAGKD